MSLTGLGRLLLALVIATLWLAPSQREHADTNCTVTLGTPLAFGNVAANGTTDAVRMATMTGMAHMVASDIKIV